MRTLTILLAGNIRHDELATLSSHFDSIGQIELAIPPDDPLETHKAAVNRAIDAAPNGWILIVRQGEIIDEALAGEISASAADAPVAWGFRLRTTLLYRGRPLRLGEDREGEVRLLHRRHGRFDLRSETREMKVEGPVMRLGAPIRRATFASAAAHRAALQQTLVPHSAVRHLLVFANRAIVTGAWKGRWATLQYLWIEAGFDHGERTETRPLQRSR